MTRKKEKSALQLFADWIAPWSKQMDKYCFEINSSKTAFVITIKPKQP